jgi:glycosyltransferase involved in cell wall biosynthesis
MEQIAPKEGESLSAVLHINTERTWRGGESQVFYLVTGLKKSGYRVCVAALPGSALAARCREAGIDLFEVRMAADLDVGAASRIARFAKLGRFDILHGHTARAHALGVLARLLGAPARLVVARRLDFPVSRNLFGRMKYRSSRVDMYLAVADVIRRILIDAGVRPEKVRVVNSCIDLARFEAARRDRKVLRAEVRAELGLPAGTPLVGNNAALADHKSQIDLVAAAPRILREVPDAHVVIAGEGKERPNLESKIRDLDLTGRVHLLGFRKDVPRLLGALDVFAMSSKLEGFCNSVLEAFAVEIPVASTDAGGLPEMVFDGKTGLLTPVHDPAALASAIVRLLLDKNLGATLAAAGRRLVESKHTVEKMVEQTRAAYADLLSSGS